MTVPERLAAVPAAETLDEVSIRQREVRAVWESCGSLGCFHPHYAEAMHRVSAILYRRKDSSEESSS